MDGMAVSVPKINTASSSEEKTWARQWAILSDLSRVNLLMSRLQRVGGERVGNFIAMQHDKG